MKAHSMPTHDLTDAADEVTITISASTHYYLVNLPIPGGTVAAKPATDGMVTFTLPRMMFEHLLTIDPDPDRAYQILLGLKTH
jgi:hypothetical protein